MTRETDVTVTTTDPHPSWVAELKALSPEYDALKAIPSDQLPDEYDERWDGIAVREDELLAKIRSTPATTVDGALAQLELNARHEIETGVTGLTDREIKWIHNQLAAAATIKRALLDR